MEHQENGGSTHILLLNHNLKHDSLIIGCGLIFGLIGIGTIFFHFVEGHSRFNSFYFIVMTMATVGYGDIVPVTIGGKILTIIYALAGVPLFIFTASFFVEYRIRSIVKHYNKHAQHQFVRFEENVDELEENVDKLEENVDELGEHVEKLETITTQNKN